MKSGKQQGGAAAEEMPLLALGEKVYTITCVTCHQPNGAGNPANQIPPLDGSEWVAGSEAGELRLIALLMKGVTGPITVKGQTFNSPQMQNFGAQMKPRQLAAVLSYVRQAWSNKAGEITEAQVLAAKKDPRIQNQTQQFTVEQLKAIPVDAPIEGAPAAGAPVAASPAGGTSAPAPGTAPAAAAVATPAAPASAPAAGSFDLAASVKRGQPLYMQTCFACHQTTGMGIPGAFPPIVGVDYVTGDTRRLIAIALKGITGPMTVDGKTYVAGMIAPVMQFPQLKDDKNLADVLNHVRNSFANKAAEPITPELVGKVRAEFASDVAPFTEATLKNFK
jgi:mono/diheme cytochrome c family protein